MVYIRLGVELRNSSHHLLIYPKFIRNFALCKNNLETRVAGKTLFFQRNNLRSRNITPQIEPYYLIERVWRLDEIR